jgi:hypothetical protein
LDAVGCSNQNLKYPMPFILDTPEEPYIPTPSSAHALQQLKLQAQILREERIKQSVLASLLIGVIAFSGALLGYALVVHFSKRHLEAAQANDEESSDDEKITDDILEDDGFAMATNGRSRFKRRFVRRGDPSGDIEIVRHSVLKNFVELMESIELE